MAKNWTGEIGSTGLAQWNGVIQDEFLRELRGVQGYRRYDEMRRNEPVIVALLNAIEQAIRGVDWNITSDEEDDPRAEFVRAALDGMTTDWHDHISECLTMLPFGWAFFETIYRREGGRLVWDALAIRGQDTLYRWEIDQRGRVVGMVQTANLQTVTIPTDKGILYRTRIERGNPEGRSILRGCWLPYYYAKNLRSLEAIGLERFGAGLPVITLPEGASTDSGTGSDASKAAQMVRNVRQDEQAGLVLPSGWQFDFKAASGGLPEFDTVIRRYESRMLMTSLAQFLALGQDRVGSQALSKDQSDFFNMSVNSIADTIARTFTAQAIRPLLALNGFDPEGVRMEHSPAGDADLASYGAFLQQVGGLLTWTPDDEAWLRGLARMPELDQDTAAESEAETPGAQMPDEMPEDDEMSAITARQFGRLISEIQMARRAVGRG